jgi:hypothetical protein
VRRYLLPVETPPDLAYFLIPFLERDSKEPLLTRREVLAGIAMGLILPSFLFSKEGEEWEGELAPYNPFLPPLSYFQNLKGVAFDPPKIRKILRGLLDRFRATRKLTYAEGLLIYTYILWRALPPGKEREEVIRFASTLGAEVTDALPKAPTGYFFTVMATGFTALSAGVINALHLIPTYQKMLLKAIEIQKGYMWGMPLILLGAMYMKLPPFPISLGDMKKAGEYFEYARPYAGRKFGIWHSFYGEYLYLTRGIEAIHSFFEESLKGFRPENALHVYSMDLALRGLLLIEEAVRSGRYDKYLWSPLLIPSQPYGLKPGDF